MKRRARLGLRSRLGSLVLAAGLGACGARSDAAHAPPLSAPATPTGAEPALVAPSAPVGELRASGCEFSPRYELGDDPVLGVYFDRPANQLVLVRYVERVRLELERLDTTDGARHPLRTVLLPAGVEPMLAWRSSAGEPLISYRSAGTLRLARVDGSAFEELTPLLRYGTTYYLDATPTREEWLGPLDDPSESRFVGLAMAARSGGAMAGVLCVTDTVGMRASRCQYSWANGEPFRSLYQSSGTVSLAHGRAYSNLSSTTAQLGVTQSSYSWTPLGPPGPVNPYAAATARVARAVEGDLARGGVMLGVLGASGVAFFARANGPLMVQLIDAFAQPVLDPLPMPFTEARWLDVQPAYGEVFATVQTRADRIGAPMMTTLVRFYPTLPARAPVTSPPQRVALSDARLIALTNGEILLYSRSERAAVVGRCGTLVR